jgi:excisionase family DNA binding protein
VAQKDDFLSFDEALHVLSLKEEELKRLVSEGEIRAFREGETMRLRKTDVDALRKELSGGAAVDLAGATEELVFADEGGADAGMATQEIAAADTLLDDGVEEVLEEVAAPRRRAPAASTEAPEAFEGVGMRMLLIATSVLLLLALPVVIGVSSGGMSGVGDFVVSIVAALTGRDYAPAG